MEQNYICKYCGKECKNNNSLRNHERLCKLNPDKQFTKFMDIKWQKNKKVSNQFIKAIEEGKEKPKYRAKRYLLENGDIVNCSEQTKRRFAKDYLEEKYGHKCMICGNSEWLGKPILLIADHIDGDPTHNNIDNFRLICSNCDATLETYKNRNKIRGKRKNRKKYYNKSRIS